MADIDYTAVSPLLELFRVDFAADAVADVPRAVAVEFVALATGRVDALMLTWDVSLDAAGDITVSTHPERSQNSFERDMVWGQALVFLSDDGEAFRAFQLSLFSSSSKPKRTARVQKGRLPSSSFKRALPSERLVMRTK